MIFPMFALFWGFFWTIFVQYSRKLDRAYTTSILNVKHESLAKLFIKMTIWVYISYELKEVIVNQINQNTGDKEVYNLFHGRSNVLLEYDYQSLAKEHPDEQFTNITELESVFYSNKYDTPVRMYAHTPGDKITVTYNGLYDPFWLVKKYIFPLKSMKDEFPHMKGFPFEPSKN